QVESDSVVASECGRCGPCREAQMPTRSLDQILHRGLERVWKLPTTRVPWRSTIHIEHDISDYSVIVAEFVPKLARLGYMQFIVADAYASECASTFKAIAGHPGLLLGFEEKCVHNW